MSAYSGASALAKRMISAKGRSTTFTRANATALDPITGAGGGGPQTFTAPAVAFEMSAGRAAFIFGAGAANISKRRLSVYIALQGASYTPQEGDRMAWASATLRLISVQLLDPDGSGTPFFAECVAEA